MELVVQHFPEIFPTLKLIHYTTSMAETLAPLQPSAWRFPAAPWERWTGCTQDESTWLWAGSQASAGLSFHFACIASQQESTWGQILNELNESDTDEQRAPWWSFAL